MLEFKKRESVDRHVIVNSMREPLDEVCSDPGPTESGERASLQHALHAARKDERALCQRLHRVHDPKGMDLLRGLRARISGLEERLSHLASDVDA